jgi:hypothetical protein
MQKMMLAVHGPVAYNALLGEPTMKIFRPYGTLANKHDIGVVFDNNGGTEYIGTAILCRSTKHTSISVNKQDFKFASKCVQYMFCHNNQNQRAVIPMEQAIELFKRGRDHGEFVVIEWFEIEQPSGIYELPWEN